MATSAYKVQIACAQHILISFISDNADAKHWFATQVNDGRSKSKGTETMPSDCGLLVFHDMFGNTIAVDPMQVIAVLVQPLDDDELRAVRYEFDAKPSIAVRQ